MKTIAYPGMLLSLLLLTACGGSGSSGGSSPPDSPTPEPSPVPAEPEEQEQAQGPFRIGDRLAGMGSSMTFQKPDSVPLLDDQGRQLILNGINSGSTKHAEMRRFWETKDVIDHYATQMGYNAFRYLIHWDHVMPEQGVINQAYLDDIEERLT